MTSDIIAITPTALPAELEEEFGGNADDLISASGGFPVLSIRGSKWRAKVSGEEHVLKVDGNPMAEVDLVILAAQTGLSKNYYESNYAEGDNAAPACYSIDGEKPDGGAEKPQAASCAVCPRAVWGSKITEAGKKGKQCSDSKRLVVTFASNIPNEELGGPMLLRVPAASLKDLTSFARQLNAKNIDYKRIAVKMGFDETLSYPKLTFKAAYPLDTDELYEVRDARQHENVANILSGAPSDVPKPAAPAKPKAVDTEFAGRPEKKVAPIIEPAPAEAAPADEGPKVTVKKRRAAAKPEEKTPPKPEEELGSILGSLEL
jgi:hypothetical protein